MKKLFPFFVIALSLGGVAQAQVTFSSGGSLTAWNGSPAYTSIPNASLSGATTGQGDATITGSYGLLSETFTPSTAFTLGSVNLMMSVNNITNPNYILNLYDLGPAGTVSVNASAATYNPYAPLPSGIALDFTDTVTFAAGSGGEVQGTFTLPLADQKALVANEEYAIELLTPTADGAAGVTWFRNGGSPADPGGQMMSGGDGLNSAGAGLRNTLAGNGQAGGAPRIGALALYPVPEPGTFVLLVAGLPGLAWAIRRRK